MEREQQVKAGRLLDVDFFPVNLAGRRIPERAPKRNPSSEEQQMYNYNRATKRIKELIHANFDERDYVCSPTFTIDSSPQTEEEFDNMIKNFIRRVNDYKKRRGLERSFYIYVREVAVYKTGRKKENLILTVT